MCGKHGRLMNDFLLVFLEIVDLESACANASPVVENEDTRCSGTGAMLEMNVLSQVLLLKSTYTSFNQASISG
jgi:hypothetical protein